MPPIEESDLHDTVVLWVATGKDRSGKDTFGSPVEIDARWNRKDSSTLDIEGNTVLLSATAIVDREIKVGSLLWLGELSYWSGTGSARDDTDIMVVRTYNEIKDVRGMVSRRYVGLSFYKSKPHT